MREEYISDYTDTKINAEKKGVTDRVKMMRIAREISIEEFADALGVSVEQIKKIDNYEAIYTMEQECKIADILKTPVRFVRFAITDEGIEKGLL